MNRFQLYMRRQTHANSVFFFEKEVGKIALHLSTPHHQPPYFFLPFPAIVVKSM
jgi:hypothetical protein